MKLSRLLYDGDTFEYRGYNFRVDLRRDDAIGEPWKEYDGHGVVSEWTSRAKRPGERVLAEDRSRKIFYDIERTIAIARRDGWGVRRPGTDGTSRDDYKPLPNETKRAYVARAVDADFDFLRGFVTDQWWYVSVGVVLLDEDEDETDERAYLGGVESNAGAYLDDVAFELADEILSRVEVDDPDVVLSEN